MSRVDLDIEAPSGKAKGHAPTVTVVPQLDTALRARSVA